MSNIQTNLTKNNIKKPIKTSLKLPIFLIVAPLITLIFCFLLYIIVNIVLVSSNPEFNPPDYCNNPEEVLTISQGAECSKHLNSNEYTGSGINSVEVGIVNVILFSLGSLSVFAIIPCEVAGIYILCKRLEAKKVKK